MRLVLLAAVGCMSALYLHAIEPAREPITSAHAVHNMPPEEAARHDPVHLRAVLTFYDPYIDPRRGAIFVCDHSGCVFVSVPKKPILRVHPGDLVEIDGVTGPGDYASIVEASRIETVGHPGLPAHPRKVTMDDLSSGIYDTDWIQVQGRVRAIHRQPGIVSLIVAANGGSFGAVTLPQPGVDDDRLVDSLIELTANTAPAFNQRRQMVAVHLFFPSMQQVRVIEPAPPDPFAQKPISLVDMFRFSPEPSTVHRVHVQGTVTLNWPGRILCIQDRDSSLCIPVMQQDAAPVGSRVDVVGFPAIRMFKPTLEYAQFHPSGSMALPVQPVHITADRMFKDDLDDKLVQVDAVLVGRDTSAPEATLILRANGVLFSVILPREIPRGISQAWREGSLLRVTGICNAQVNTFSISIGDGIVRPESVKILLRDGGDITVLRAPSWWTPQHAWEAFGAFGLVVAVCLTWIGILRHLVKKRTEQLRSSEERLRYLSEHDILTNLPNRILFHDRLSTAMERARRFNGRIGLLMADLDGFKEINDTMGHQAGDAVLAAVAGRLAGCVRATDTVARIGGDEFVILLPDIQHPSEPETIATKLVTAIAQPFPIDGDEVRVTVSIGAVTYPEDAEDEETLMEIADETMYRAKQSGKNGVAAFQRTGHPA